MSKINTAGWKEFRIGELFNAYLSKDDIQPKNITYGSIPLVSSGKENNGIIAYIESDTAYLWKGNSISVDMFGKAFYQDKSFFCVSHGRVNILEPKITIDEYSLRFIATVIEKVASQKYEFKEMCTGTKLLKDVIKLPVDKTGNPDFLYMERYMKNLEEAVKYSLTALQLTGNVEKQMKICEWGSFPIEDLFDVVKGKRLTKANMKEGKIPFIGASAINNGITAYISNDEFLHPGNTITLSYNGSVGEAFYQASKFWASDDVNVLYPKFNMNKHVAMFIIPCLKTVGKNYGFIDKWKKEDMEKTLIRLPINSTGEIDCVYMEDYMRLIEEKMQKSLKILNMI